MINHFRDSIKRANQIEKRLQICDVEHDLLTTSQKQNGYLFQVISGKDEIISTKNIIISNYEQSVKWYKTKQAFGAVGIVAGVLLGILIVN